jgi:hypothetical protein
VWLFLFPKIKLDLKRRRFDDMEIIKRNMMQQLMLKSKTEFHRCFELEETTGISTSSHRGISPPLWYVYYCMNYKWSLDTSWTAYASWHCNITRFFQKCKTVR